MLSVAKARDYQNSGVTFLFGDFWHYVFHRRYDVAVSAFVINEMRTLNQLNYFASALNQCLFNGGRIGIEFDNALACAAKETGQNPG